MPRGVVTAALGILGILLLAPTALGAAGPLLPHVPPGPAAGS